MGKQRITNGKLGLRRKVALQEIAVLENELQAQRLKVLTDVRLAFYNLLIEQRRVELAEELERISLEAVKTISELLKNEEATRVELLQAEVEAETAKNGVEIARNNQDGAWRQMASVIGTPDEPLSFVEGELTESPIVHWDEAVQRLRSGSPEIARAMSAMEKANCATQLACAESVPDINWQAGINYDFASDDPFASLQVSMPIPINNWNQGNIRTARAEYCAAQQDVARVELDLQSRLAAAFRRYANGSQRAQRYTAQILPKARETLELVYIGYRAGEKQYPYLSLLTAQRTLFNAELTHLDALRQIWLAHSEVEGMLLSNSLAAR
jgi:cobalt-zinc-cadmium efflux system outer membrane protein